MTDDQYLIAQHVASLSIQAAKSNGQTVKYSDLRFIIDKTLRDLAFDCDSDTKKKLITDMEFEFQIKHSESSVIFGDYDDPHNWYELEEHSNSFFWSRYKGYLMQYSSIDEESINLLGNKTLPEIMNCIRNPKDETQFSKPCRGLVIGDVQSGKTSTYSGLICKAADAGYKVVILLAGITESLRQQTQERIDEGIVGYSIKKINGQIQRGLVGVGNDHKGIRVSSFTSCASDFVGNADRITTTLGSHNLVLFVIKKNVTVLKRLLNWLKEQNLDPSSGYIDFPMLMIDDEADNASINTRTDETDPTRTNKLIRRICNLFRNATYVGFTATPFANVFIDPDSYDKKRQTDLFPEDFIYVLPTPSSYIGPKRIFDISGDCHKCLRFINDIEEPDYFSDEYREAVRNDIDSLNSGQFYYKHNKEWRGEFPDSLKESIYCYFLCNAIRDIRGDHSKPRSMLVNMSRFVKVHHYIKDYVDEVYESFVAILEHDFSDNSDLNTQLPLYIELSDIWDKHFSNVYDCTFERVVQKSVLLPAVKEVKIIVVNGGNNSGKLDYKSNRSLRVIAIGGLALSRGLTLEGLMVSYFYRNTATFDVLMQMGRWFGYRPNYQDICQIWTSQQSSNWYAEISKASEELKADIKKMRRQELTPKYFGLKVRDNSEELQITAADKMRVSYELIKKESFYGNIIDTPYISYNTKFNEQNIREVSKLVNLLFQKKCSLKYADVERYKNEDPYSNSIGASRFFEGVNKHDISSFLSSILVSQVNPNFDVDSILNFINDPDTEGIDSWDVVFEGGDSGQKYPIAGLETINCISRSIDEAIGRNVIQLSSRRRVLGLREGKFALDKNVIAEVENKQREQWRIDRPNDPDNETKDIPLKAYFEFLPDRKPILIIMLIQPNKANETSPIPKKIEKFYQELGDNPIVAFAVGFPNKKTNKESQYFRVNKVYYELHMSEQPDEIEIDDEQ